MNIASLKPSTYRTVRLDKLRSHPWARLAQNAIFLVPTEFLLKISCQNPTTHTDLGDGDVGTLPTDEVWSRILAEGMNDPLVIIFSVPRDRSVKSATIRLESGNHRIGAALETGFTHLPVIGLMQANPLCHTGNGDHVYPFERKLIDDWYQRGGRDPHLYEPYPHPIDLRALISSDMSGFPVVPAFELDVVNEGDVDLIFRHREL
ncbi:hypothetical protein [Sulfitobacter sp. R18_1]|uniref:hypothetical protein n=1 Tax=Sulfitobacter sp. R18_1 TaxID=2821104 RepID=UPI001ADA47D9|nr:hypothetical protein [Sulfitobacter sp. R18_1]MBO9428040.1 hypothetical protein [Sulfitobacter sp. R18_1]